MSTSARPARRSAVRSAARSRRAAAVNPVRTHGRPTCAEVPTPSIIPTSCRWRRAWSSDERVLAVALIDMSNICHMPTARRRLSPEDRRAELLALGAEVFGKRPYDEVRIDEIAERAGVSRALMYHYFPDKRAFFAAVVKDEADRLYETTNKDTATGLTMFEEVRSGIMAYFAWHEQNPEAAWAAYVGLGRSDPVLLGTSD